MEDFKVYEILGQQDFNIAMNQSILDNPPPPSSVLSKKHIKK